MPVKTKMPLGNTGATLPWMKEAFKHNGLKEDTRKKHHNPTILAWLKILKAWWQEDETAWCGVFVAYCLKMAGFTRAASEKSTTAGEYPFHWYRALAYRDAKRKLDKPTYGCVATKTRNGGGHVFFVVGVTPSGKIVGYGGNQSNSVCYATFDPADLEYYWYGKTLRPAEHRYNLPKITNVSATKVTEA